MYNPNEALYKAIYDAQKVYREGAQKSLEADAPFYSDLLKRKAVGSKVYARSDFLQAIDQMYRLPLSQAKVLYAKTVKDYESARLDGLLPTMDLEYINSALIAFANESGLSISKPQSKQERATVLGLSTAQLQKDYFSLMSNKNIVESLKTKAKFTKYNYVLCVLIKMLDELQNDRDIDATASLAYQKSKIVLNDEFGREVVPVTDVSASIVPNVADRRKVGSVQKDVGIKTTKLKSNLEIAVKLLDEMRFVLLRTKDVKFINALYGIYVKVYKIYDSLFEKISLDDPIYRLVGKIPLKPSEFNVEKSEKRQSEKSRDADERERSKRLREMKQSKRSQDDDDDMLIRTGKMQEFSQEKKYQYVEDFEARYEKLKLSVEQIGGAVDIDFREMFERNIARKTPILILEDKRSRSVLSIEAVDDILMDQFSKYLQSVNKSIPLVTDFILPTQRNNIIDDKLDSYYDAFVMFLSDNLIARLQMVDNAVNHEIRKQREAEELRRSQSARNNFMEEYFERANEEAQFQNMYNQEAQFKNWNKNFAESQLRKREHEEKLEEQRGDEISRRQLPAEELYVDNDELLLRELPNYDDVLYGDSIPAVSVTGQGRKISIGRPYKKQQDRKVKFSVINF